VRKSSVALALCLASRVLDAPGAALRAAPAARGARAVLADHPEWVVHVPGDPGCVLGIDTPADYERWIARVSP